MTFFKHQKEDAMLLVIGFATLSQTANQCQISCCIKKLCYCWDNIRDVTRLRHKCKWSVEILMTSSIILYLKILYPNMGTLTTPGSQPS